MRTVEVHPKGVCCRLIRFSLDDEGRLHGVQFTGGCRGNLQALSVLLENMAAADARDKLLHIVCGTKGTSCAAELARSL